MVKLKQSFQFLRKRIGVKIHYGKRRTFGINAKTKEIKISYLDFLKTDKGCKTGLVRCLLGAKGVFACSFFLPFLF